MTAEERLKSALELHQAGKLSEAEAVYRELLAENPNNPEALHLLGAMRCQTGQAREAVELIGRAIAISPRAAEYHGNLGLALANMGRNDEAIASYRHALALRPQYVKVMNNLMTALMKVGRLDEAIELGKRAAHLQPKSAEHFNRLGAALYDRGEMEHAIQSYRHAIRLNPEMPEPHFNVAIVFQQLGRMDEAIEECKRAVALRPNYSQAHTNLGVVLKETGRLEEAIASYDQALATDPGNITAHSNQVYISYFHPDYGPKEIMAMQKRWSDQHAKPLRQFIKPLDNDRTPERRLRIGYVSPDFRHHVVGSNLLPLMRQHDHEQFEIFCYSSVPRADAMTGRLRSFADQWREIGEVKDAKAADMIRADKIDILVDLTLHMAGCRLTLFAHKPAPVQATYLGYCGGTALEEMDYRLSDPHMDPPDMDLAAAYTETTIHLPRTYWCYQPPDPSPRSAPLPALKVGYITFGCLNNYSKVSAAAQEVWAQILAAVPNSRIVIHSHAGSHRQAVIERFEKAGVDKGRVEFISKQAVRQYFHTYDRIDIALDPFPYGGGITTCDGLWMGVPAITLSSRNAIGRGGRSILSNIGLPELIAFSPEQYKQIAVDLAGNLPRLTELRNKLREQMYRSPLMDAASFARDVEAAYRTMWRRYCERTA
jgi:protein O-GlcNAc transferase